MRSLIAFRGNGLKNYEMTVHSSEQGGQVRQADNDNQVLTMWLYGRPATTQWAYAYEVRGLMAVVSKPLKAITLGDLQGDCSTLEPLPRPGPSMPQSPCLALLRNRLSHL